MVCRACDVLLSGDGPMQQRSVREDSIGDYGYTEETPPLSGATSSINDEDMVDLPLSRSQTSASSVESIRNMMQYQMWPGHNYFLCGGRIVMGAE
eukprot:g21572.t1